MFDMYGYIYMTTNIANGKFYIGKHKSESFDETYLGSGVALGRAITKYGRENFVCVMLDTAESLEELNIKEKYYIKQYDAQTLGYNIAPGGDGGEVWGDPLCHPSLGKQRTDMIGNKNPMYGKQLSEEIRERIRQQLSGRRRIVKGDKIKLVNADDLQSFLDDGWMLQTEVTAQQKKEKIPKNHTGWHHTEESKKKISESGRKTKSTKEYRERQSIIAKSAYQNMPDEQKAERSKRLRESHLGKKRTEESKRKASESMKEGYRSGRITPGMKGKTAWNKGVKVSEEQKKILSERAKGRIWINNGVENKMIYPDEYTHWESLGYSKGRTKFSKHKEEEE